MTGEVLVTPAAIFTAIAFSSVLAATDTDCFCCAACYSAITIYSSSSSLSYSAISSLTVGLAYLNSVALALVVAIGLGGMSD